MKSVLSFILIFFFSFQIFSQNLQFVKTNEKDLKIWTAKTGKVLHKLSESYYSNNGAYGKSYNRSTDKGKTWKSDKIINLIASVRSEYIKKNNNAGLFSKYEYSEYPACLFNDNVIIFINGISLKSGDEIPGLHEAIYSEDGINFKYISPFEINSTPLFKLIDDTHFIAINYEEDKYIVTINKRDKDLTTDIIKIKITDIPFVEDGKLFWTSGNDIFISSDFGKTTSKIYSDAAQLFLQDVLVKNDLMILTTYDKFIVSKDNGKTFIDCAHDNIDFPPVCFKDKFYFLRGLDGFIELVLDKNTLETKPCGSTIKNVPELNYICDRLWQADDNIVLSVGELAGNPGEEECEKYTYYLLK